MEGYDSTDQWICDVCESTIAAGVYMYGCRDCSDGGYDICEVCYGSLDIMQHDSNVTFPLDELMDDRVQSVGIEGKGDDDKNVCPRTVIYQALSMEGSASRALAEMVPLVDTTDGMGNGTRDDPVVVLPYRLVHLGSSEPDKSYHIPFTRVASAAGLIARLEALEQPGAYGIISLPDLVNSSRKEAMGHTLNFYHTKLGVCFIDAKLKAKKDRVITGAKKFQGHLDTTYCGKTFECQTDTFFFCICGGVPLDSVVSTTRAKAAEAPNKVKTEPVEGVTGEGGAGEAGFVGKKFMKKFPGYGVWEGTVRAELGNGKYVVDYTDGDEETLSRRQLTAYITA
jgi:hypothetical protein